MKAILLTEYGDVSKLQLRDVPSPTPKKGEVRVKVAFTSINPVDYKIRDGSAKAMFPQTFPAILGKDVAGEVIEDAEGFKKGDKVLAFVDHTYAEEVVVPAANLARVPEGLSLEQAAALPLVVTTGAELVDRMNVQKGQTVLVTGALGPVARTAVYLFKERGAKVIAGVRKKDKEKAKDLRADSVIGLDDEADLKALPELDALASTVYGDLVNKLLPHVKKGGTVGSVVGPVQGAEERGLKVVVFSASPNAKNLQLLAEAVAKERFRIPIVKKFKLEQMAQAHTAAEKGPGGKIVIAL